MPEAAAVAIADFLAIDVGVSATTAIVLSEIAVAAMAATTVYSIQEQQRKAAAAQRDAYNASLRDRYVMQRGSTMPRTLVLGRQRVSGPPFFIGSYGANKEYLALCVPLAAHEIDAVEEIYFGDDRVVLDDDGNVTNILRREEFSLTGTGASFIITTEPDPATVTASIDYGDAQADLTVSVSGTSVTVSGASAARTGMLTIRYQPKTSPFINNNTVEGVTPLNLDSSGNGSVSIPDMVVPGSVRVLDPSTDGFAVDLTDHSTYVGNVVTVSGYVMPGTTQVKVCYQLRVGNQTLCNIKTYLGAAGQVADPDLIAALPSLWTSNHRADGIAYLRVECTYDQTAWPTGLPNISATIRGAKVYDVRTGITAWSENPALLMRHAAMHPLCGRLSADLIADDAIAAAANVCDQTTTYTINGVGYIRPLYTAGMVHRSGTRPQDTINDLAQAMAGRWAFSLNQLIVRAGAWRPSVVSIDESWLSSDASISVQSAPNRQDVVNTITGQFVDERRDYKLLQFPDVPSDEYKAIDGAELPLNRPLNAVTFVGQAQQVSAAWLRDSRQGLSVSLPCKMHAFAIQVFDVVSVSLARFGWVNKAFEVLDIRWTFGGAIVLSLKETDPSIWALGLSFDDVDVAPNTRLPSPSEVPGVTGVAAASGTSHLIKQSDGTIMSRLSVTWSAITDTQVLQSGGVEVRWGAAGTPESEWQSVWVPGTQSQVYLLGVRDGNIYSVKCRAYNALARGVWSVPILHKVVGKTQAPSPVSGLSAQIVPGAVRISLTPPDDIDFARTVLKYGSSYESGSLIADIGSASVYPWVWPDPGSYTIWAATYDTSGNQSTPVSTTIGFVKADLIPGAVVFRTLATDAAGIGYSNVA